MWLHSFLTRLPQLSYNIVITLLLVSWYRYLYIERHRCAYISLRGHGDIMPKVLKVWSVKPFRELRLLANNCGTRQEIWLQKNPVLDRFRVNLTPLGWENCNWEIVSAGLACNHVSGVFAWLLSAAPLASLLWVLSSLGSCYLLYKKSVWSWAREASP